MLQQVDQFSHPIDRLYAQLCAVHAFHHGSEQRIVFLTQAIAATGGAQMQAIIEVGERVFEPHRRAAAERLREGIKAKTVAECDTDALMALVRAAQDGLLVQRLMNGIELAPVHEFLWKQVLSPLKRTPKNLSRDTSSKPSITKGSRSSRAAK